MIHHLIIQTFYNKIPEKDKPNFRPKLAENYSAIYNVRGYWLIQCTNSNLMYNYRWTDIDIKDPNSIKIVTAWLLKNLYVPYRMSA